VGLAVIAIAVAWIFYMQRGAHIEPAGRVLKVRTLGFEDNSSVAVVDFRVVNSSDYQVIVRDVTVTADVADGRIAEGSVISEADAQRLFQYYPILGQKYNDSLIMRTHIRPHESMDRMIVARFEVPQSMLDARKAMRVRIEDVDGPSGELVETK
jgi:hypothetical protein